MMSVIMLNEKMPSSPESTRRSESEEEIIKNDFRKKRKNRRTKRHRHAPYSAKNFLGRPKINAPANTTQFLFDDKGLGLETLFDSDNDHSDRASTSLDTSSESDKLALLPAEATDGEVFAQQEGTHMSVYNADEVTNDADKFHEEQFECMYNDIRAEMLRQETVESLTNRCLELETAIHSFRFLLKKETERSQQIKELEFLKQRNTQLEEENKQLRCNNMSNRANGKVDSNVQEPTITSSV